nr:hypothetical protein [uncultured Mediterranean phage uvMED]
MSIPENDNSDKIINGIYEQIFYLKSLRGNNFYDEQKKPSLKANILLDDEELAEAAYCSLGMGEQRFLPSNKYGPKK